MAVALAEDAEDIRMAESAMQEVRQGEDELIPAEFVERLFSGENRVRLWREFRGMTQQALADAAGLSQAYVAQIENDQRQGSVAALTSLARVLRVDLDDLAGEAD